MDVVDAVPSDTAAAVFSQSNVAKKNLTARWTGRQVVTQNVNAEDNVPADDVEVTVSEGFLRLTRVAANLELVPKRISPAMNII